ncbi:MAG: TMEM165/GDT1 family protein [Gammaproteobacteria bacterium]|nr:TMEM165/GDT1 family protein [Gammaproteobacteria bacterium]
MGGAARGDRSLFLAILLGVRFRRLWPVFWGMVTGLFINQLLSAFAGVWLFAVLPAEWHGLLVGAVFLAMAVWVLFPEDESKAEKLTARSIFLTSALAFFILEMADKTQLAVVTLAGAGGSVWPVVFGATIGILLVTTPALLLGWRFAAALPMRALRLMAAALFALLGLWLVLDGLDRLPDIGLPSPARLLDGLGEAG